MTQVFVPDLLCVDDVDPFASETTSDLQTLEQDVYHVLIEVPGSNPDDPDRGIGIDQILSSPTTRLPEITRLIDSQLLKDDRITSSRSSFEQLEPGSALPDGTLLPDGGYLLTIEIVASENVLSLNYQFTPTGGLVPR